MQLVKVSISQQVIEFFSASISGKSWKIGEKIPSENALTRELGVSRSSIRAAIQHFIAIGVLDSVHGKGTFLRSNDLVAIQNNLGNIGQKECRDISKVLEFRLILEPQGCWLAAERAGPATIEVLRGCLHGQVENIGNSVEFVKHDMEFHLEICRASENPLLHKALGEVFEQTRQNHNQINDMFGYKDGVYYHSLILKAFESRDAKEAKRLMTEHLQQALDQLENRR